MPHAGGFLDIPIKVINLARSQGRRESFARDNPELHYEFVEGVDGHALTEAQLDASGLFIPPLGFPSMGAFGAALSHLKLWDWAIENDSPVTVVEDDAVFRRDFPQMSRRLLSEVRDDWDFLLWGWNFDSFLSVTTLGALSPAVMVFSEASLRSQVDMFKDTMRMPQALGLHMASGLPAYTISPQGARKFRQQCFPMRHFELTVPVFDRKMPNIGIDVAMSRIYGSTHAFVAFPPLVITRNERGISTIQA